MATITQRGDKFRVQVRLGGVSKSATFNSKSEAREWATRTEALILDGQAGNVPRYMTLGDILKRYLETVTPNKRGQRTEALRISRFLRHAIASVYLDQLKPSHVAQWRDERLKQVKSDTVLREIGTLSAVCKLAVMEWGVLRENPVHKITKPSSAPARTRRPLSKEINIICQKLGYFEDKKIDSRSERVAVATLFAIETAMRAGEICALTWNDIDFKQRLAHIRMSKNGHPRDVPLSKKALALLEPLKGLHEESVFDLQPAVLDVLFRRARDACQIEDLHFHDTRREALTRMAKKVDVMTLAKISGHRDIRILLNTYYRPDMSTVADLLD